MLCKTYSNLTLYTDYSNLNVVLCLFKTKCCDLLIYSKLNVNPNFNLCHITLLKLTNNVNPNLMSQSYYVVKTNEQYRVTF